MSQDRDRRAGDERGRGAARPDHHDPTGGLGGLPPAHSALTLRLVLAGFGLLACLAFGIWNALTDGPFLWTVVLGVLAVAALADLIVVLRRKARGEPG